MEHSLTSTEGIQKQLFEVESEVVRVQRVPGPIIENVRSIRAAHIAGLLGGEIMPEDAAPDFQGDQKTKLLYFTLTMALNYQRNSYRLWESATAAFLDADTRCIFDPFQSGEMSDDELRERLVRHGIALQPVRHLAIWRKISTCLSTRFRGDVAVLLEAGQCDVALLQKMVREDLKKELPYISGPKIFNYWLYVLEQYCGVTFHNRQLISVAPDTHIMQASVRLGLVSHVDKPDAAHQGAIAAAWVDVLQESELTPIDVHTPLWLWSRAGFPDVPGLGS